MARSLVLGNGGMLLTFDAYGQVADLYYPHAGLENHIAADMVHKVGVFVDGVFAWLSDPGWDITLSYAPETMAGNIVARNEALALELRFSDVVYNEQPVFVRSVAVYNHAGHRREVKVFFNQQFRISESSYGDTAYFSSQEHAVIHYKGRRLFLVSGQAGEEFFSEYSIGLLGIEGREGTWRDAERGVLSGNPIEHGTVDSVVGFKLMIGPATHKSLSYWLCAACTFDEAVDLHAQVLKKTPAHIEATTSDYWRAWVNARRFDFHRLSPDVVAQFKRSLLIMRTHADQEGGIIASGDSSILQDGRDTYSYIWPRDAVFAARAFDKTGYAQIARRFYEFCGGIITRDGYVLHKYRPDRSLGSSWHAWVRDGRAQLPIQEDETALILWGLWEHYEKSRNLEFIEQHYNTLIEPAAEFMQAYRDHASGLPLPSHGLWEERFAVGCFTSASVFAGLRAAHRFAKLLGKEIPARQYGEAAEEVRRAVLAHFYLPEQGAFAKLLAPDGDRLVVDPTIDASSVYGIFRFGLLEINDERLVRAWQKTDEALSVRRAAGGLARYEGDEYYRADAATPGNPWFITTLWKSEYDVARAQNEEELVAAIQGATWALEHAYGAGMFSEQIDPNTGAPVSVAPLSWSHAQYVLLVVAYLERLEELGICKTCYPLTS